MNVLELMDSKATSFSKTEAKIYSAIKKFPDSFAHETISEISEKSKFTKPALTRFAQKLGFSGYTEFQFQFSKDLETVSNTEKKSLAAIYSDVLYRTEDSIKIDSLLPLVKKIKGSHMVYTKGTNLSRFPAEELTIGLNLSTDLSFSFIQQDIDNKNFKENDVLIVYSARSGDSHQELCRYLRKKDCIHPHSVLVTTNAKNPIRHNFSEVIVLPSITLQDGKEAILSDTFTFLLFNQLLLSAIKKED